MKKRLALCVVFVTLLGCNTSPTVIPSSLPAPSLPPPSSPIPTAVLPTPTKLPAANASGIVIATDGQLSVKRDGWQEYVRAIFGTPLYFGDLLRLDAPAQATIVCADLKRLAVPTGLSGVPCQVAKPILVYQGSIVNVTRNYSTSEFPIVVSPRKTKLLNPRPTLRWTPMASMSDYQVMLQGQGVNWSAKVGSVTQIIYPRDAPALVPGATYKVTVVGDTRSSNEETLPGLGFTMLTAEEEQAVRKAEADIRVLNLGDTPTRFLIANLYASLGLNAEAIEQLEELASKSKEPAISRLLGDLYVKVALNRHAEERYLHTTQFSPERDEGLALAHQALASIYAALGNKGEAIQRLQQTLEFYRSIGDSRTVLQIQQTLAELQKP